MSSVPGTANRRKKIKIIKKKGPPTEDIFGQFPGTFPGHSRDTGGRIPGHSWENPETSPWPPQGQTVKYRNRVRGLVVCEVCLSWWYSCCRLGSRYSIHLRAPHARCNGVFGHDLGHFRVFRPFYNSPPKACLTESL